MNNPRFRRYTNRNGAAILAALLSPVWGLAQQPCAAGVRIEGTVTDPSGAVVAGAQVQASNGETTTTDATGRYVLPCVPVSSAAITVQAEGFSPRAARAHARAGETAHLNVQLELSRLETAVQVSANATPMDVDQGAGGATLTTKDVQRLADDPDDFLRQLQVLASSAGGDPNLATIVVDGFQNGSALPPKSSIASIRVNPDDISPEYQQPAWRAGRIEITTKAGADSFHGALFLADSDHIFNATDPLSTTATSASKQRYGFELSGPLVRKKSDFFLALEKRDIDEFNIVDAVTLDANDNQAPVQQAVAAPQRLWIASARGDWQVTSKDVATLSFSSNVNNLGNQGVGGLTLPEAGYFSLVSEYDLRFTNTQTVNANMVHETHIGYTWKARSRLRTQQLRRYKWRDTLMAAVLPART